MRLSTGASFHGFVLLGLAAGNLACFWPARSEAGVTRGRDKLAPVVTSFSVPASSASFQIPILSFTASDNVGVTGFLVNESATKPLASASGWRTSAPTSYAVTSAGSKILYAWAKDASGKVSAGKSAGVTITLPSPSPSPPPSAEGTKRIIPTQDLSYLGAFRVPIDRQEPGGKWFGYSSGFLSFNPTGNGGQGTLMLMGQENAASSVGEITIPENPGTGDISTLPRAVQLQPFTDVRGALGAVQTGSASQKTYGITVVPPGGAQAEPKLYWLSIYDYMPGNTSTPSYGASLGCSNLDFSNLNPAGQWNLDGTVPAQYAWYALTIPKAWADAHVSGQTLGLGRDRINSSPEGWGPSLYTTAPWNQGFPPSDQAQLANTKLLGYPKANPVLRNYSHGDGSRGAAWATIGGKSAFIVAYNKGTRTASDTGTGDYPYEDYKTGSHIGIPATEIAAYQPTSTDYKAGPWFGILLFFDTDQLAEVAKGLRLPDSVKPYAVFNVEKHLKRPQGVVPSKNLPIGGVTFDPQRNRLYLVELTVDGAYPLVHVFELRDLGTTLPTTPPTVPGNIRNEGAVVSWSPSVGSSGTGISYVVFKWFPPFVSAVTGKSWPAMWRPIAGTTQTTWTDPAYSPGDTYSVTAYDALMHPSNILNTGP